MPKLTQAVWQYRYDKMTSMMDELAVDAVIFTSADFFQFATNFHTDVLPWERPIFAIVPRNGTPFLVMNELSTHHMQFSQEQGKVWITDISYYAEHPRRAEPAAFDYAAARGAGGKVEGRWACALAHCGRGWQPGAGAARALPARGRLTQRDARVPRAALAEAR